MTDIDQSEAYEKYMEGLHNEVKKRSLGGLSLCLPEGANAGIDAITRRVSTRMQIFLEMMIDDKPTDGQRDLAQECVNKFKKILFDIYKVQLSVQQNIRKTLGGSTKIDEDDIIGINIERHADKLFDEYLKVSLWFKHLVKTASWSTIFHHAHRATLYHGFHYLQGLTQNKLFQEDCSKSDFVRAVTDNIRDPQLFLERQCAALKALKRQEEASTSTVFFAEAPYVFRQASIRADYDSYLKSLQRDVESAMAQDPSKNRKVHIRRAFQHKQREERKQKKRISF